MAKRKIRLAIDIDPSVLSGAVTRRKANSAGSAKRRQVYGLAKIAAKKIALGNRLRVCTVDDVKTALKQRGHEANVLGSAISGVFRSSDWERFPIDAHGRGFGTRPRCIGMWRLKPVESFYEMRQRVRSRARRARQC